MRNGTTLAAALVLAGLGWTVPAWAGSHLWRIHELFTNADGTVQFIEMQECCGAANEIFIANKWVQSDSNALQYVFPENLLPNSTANKHLLLATAAFAALPGAPAPDHIVPDNFIDIGGDAIRYWLYAPAVLEFGPGELPTDGIHSLNMDGTVGVNSPTNFSDEEGMVDVSVPAEYLRGDVDGNGAYLPFADAVFLFAYGFVPGSPAPVCLDAADVDDNGAVEPLTDGLYLLNSGFVAGSPPVPAPFPACGSDPTPDVVTCLVGCP